MHLIILVCTQVGRVRRPARRKCIAARLPPLWPAYEFALAVPPFLSRKADNYFVTTRHAEKRLLFDRMFRLCRAGPTGVQGEHGQADRCVDG